MCSQRVSYKNGGEEFIIFDSGRIVFEIFAKNDIKMPSEIIIFTLILPMILLIIDVSKIKQKINKNDLFKHSLKHSLVHINLILICKLTTAYSVFGHNFIQVLTSGCLLLPRNIL